jgi:hypothetical protein
MTWGRPPGLSRPAELARRARRIADLLLSLLRELGDENAYARHLAIHGRVHSGEEWRRFSEERLRAKYARAKCC